MDWTTEIEHHRARLQRIVMLLFAMADLADRASRRSLRVRCEVLFILSHGEAFARALVLEEAQACAMPILSLPMAAHDDAFSAGDALRLAAHFRALAAILAYAWAHLHAATPRRRSRHSQPSNLICPTNPTCKARRVRRGVGFRALDSPLPAGG